MAVLDTTKHEAKRGLTGVIAATVDLFLVAFRELVVRRKLRSQLSGLSEHHLRDIAITRSDLAALDSLPLGASSEARILQARAERSNNW